MRSKILRSTMTMAVVVLLCTAGLILGSLSGYYNDLRSRQLRDQLSLAATAAEHSGLEFFRSLAPSPYRLTWIDPEGSVLYDTHVPAEALGSHLDREEFQEALRTGTGSSTRISDTLTEKTAYEAVALSDGTILRISTTLDSLLGLMVELIPVLLLSIGGIVLLSFYMSRRISRRIVAPINRIDPENPLASETDPEIRPLVDKLHSQNEQLHRQMMELKERAQEFRRITDSMQEGLILTDPEGTLRSINPAACRIFHCEERSPAPALETLDPGGELVQAFSAAVEGGHSTVRLLREGRYYRMDLSRIEREQTILGMVLLAIDITESVNAQINRREFTANVSHELKTPLQTILGSAELLENGLVRPEDQPRFYGHIRKEATRLLDLVRDLLRLSQFEEGAAMAEEPVDMQALCAECLAELRPRAARKHITIQEETEAATLPGVPRMLRELVSNLCRNAILYNVEGGSLLLRLQKTPHGLVLTVKDTGIGIPPEHHEKIFERFYRVDKSHSRASGGTGLGLSIVKHAAEYHKAAIRLSSAPGKGTEITVSFPVPIP